MPDLTTYSCEELMRIVMASCSELTHRFPDVPCQQVRDEAARLAEEMAR